MKLLNKTEQLITLVTYTVEYKGDRYQCVDYVNKEGNVVMDTVITDEIGNIIQTDEPQIYEEICEFLNEIEE
jgi:hypothetical protein